MSASSLIARILMAGGAVIACLVVYFALARVHWRLVRRRDKKIAERLRDAKRMRSASSGDTPLSKATDDSPLSEKEDPQVRAKRLREAIDGAHARLNVRAGAFLAFNGTVLGILAGFKPMPAWSVSLTLAAILVNFIGLTSNYQYVTDMHIMHLEHEEIAPNDPAVRALRDSGVSTGRLSPTIAFAMYLPGIVTLGWFAFLVSVWPF